MTASELIDEDGFGDIGYSLRDYQVDCLDAVRNGWKQARRQLIVLAGGLGKTVLAANIARECVHNGGRVLFLAHRDELLEQGADKFERACGLECDKEKGDDRASLQSAIVMASVQTLSRIDRLTGFPDDHFALVITDEAHRALAPTSLRVLNYFHFGEDSLDPSWIMPGPDEPYQAKSHLLGLTATPSRADKRSLGEIFQRVAFEYDLLQAVRHGYLVRPIVENIPVKIDLRGIAKARTPDGMDLPSGEVASRIAPIIQELAKQICQRAKAKKTIVFMPSVETAMMMAEACEGYGLEAGYVSGKCPDRAEKVQWFREAGQGSLLANAMLMGEGVDIPDITAVCVLRATMIWSAYVQWILRGTRTLTGTIDGLQTAEERLAAIAASEKPTFTVFDFLFLTERIDLIKPVDIVATKPEIRKAMIDSGEVDLVASEAKAERDMLGALEKATKKHSKKQGRTIDPLAWCVSLGDAALAGYEPLSKWDELPAHPNQLKFLAENGINTDRPICRGLADRILERILSRTKLGLASPKQLAFLVQLGMPENEAALLSKGKAGIMIQVMSKRRFHR